MSLPMCSPARLATSCGRRSTPVARELMEAEISAEIGAARGEVSAERRTHRNGYRPRPWETRVGEIALAIPRARSLGYFPSFLEPRRRSEQAIVAVVLEAYVNGVSTRKVDRLVEQLGLQGMTKDRVSCSPSTPSRPSHWSQAAPAPARARQPRDRPPLRRRRHLPQRRRVDPTRRHALDRAERRVARQPPLPLR